MNTKKYTKRTAFKYGGAKQDPEPTDALAELAKRAEQRKTSVKYWKDQYEAAQITIQGLTQQIQNQASMLIKAMNELRRVRESGVRVDLPDEKEVGFSAGCCRDRTRQQELEKEAYTLMSEALDKTLDRPHCQHRGRHNHHDPRNIRVTSAITWCIVCGSTTLWLRKPQNQNYELSEVITPVVIEPEWLRR